MHFKLFHFEANLWSTTHVGTRTQTQHFGFRRTGRARARLAHSAAASYTIYCSFLPFPYALTTSFYKRNFRRRLRRLSDAATGIVLVIAAPLSPSRLRLCPIAVPLTMDGCVCWRAHRTGDGTIYLWKRVRQTYSPTCKTIYFIIKRNVYGRRMECECLYPSPTPNSALHFRPFVCCHVANLLWCAQHAFVVINIVIIIVVFVVVVFVAKNVSFSSRTFLYLLIASLFIASLSMRVPNFFFCFRLTFCFVCRLFRYAKTSE